MGILDVPAYSRPQADTLFSRQLATPSKAPRAGKFLNLVPVASNSMVYHDGDFPITVAQTSRSAHTFAVDCSDISAVFSNSYVTNADPRIDVANANSITIKASWEVGGVFYPMTFNGAASVTISPGGVVTSDPFGGFFAAGSSLYSRVYVNSTNYYANRTATGAGGAGGTASGDLTAGGTITDAMVNMYCTDAVLGHTADAPISIVNVGDSITYGIGDSNASGFGRGISVGGSGGGYMARYCFGRYPLITVARPGDRAQNFASLVGSWSRARFMQYGTHVIDNYGRNDLTQSLSLASIQANKLTIAKMCRAKSLTYFAATVTPSTDSTDSWATVGNQTPRSTANNANRILLNAWLRAGAPIDPTTKAAVAVGTSGALLAGSPSHPMAGYIEIADIVESARDSGLWKAGYALDGTHPSTTGHTAIAAALDLSALLAS